MPFGAVRLALLPSEWAALLPMKQRVPSWRRIPPPTSKCSAPPASSTATAPMASERAYPFARASKVLQRPSAESMPARANVSVVLGTKIRLAAATRAAKDGG